PPSGQGRQFPGDHPFGARCRARARDSRADDGRGDRDNGAGPSLTVRFGLRGPVTPWQRPGIALCDVVGLSTQAPSDRCFKGYSGVIRATWRKPATERRPTNVRRERPGSALRGHRSDPDDRAAIKNDHFGDVARRSREPRRREARGDLLVWVWSDYPAAMTDPLDQLVNEYEAAASRLTELHRRWGWIVLLGPRLPGPGPSRIPPPPPPP